VVLQVHVASGHYLNEVDAHGGRRVWSVCHSKLRPHLAATASDDCTAKIWAGRGLAAAVATIRLPGTPAVCGVDFCGWDENLLSLAAADHCVHLYDLRRLAAPLKTLSAHRRAVSYAKFAGPGQLVSASIDGTLMLWDLGHLVMGLDALPAACKMLTAPTSAAVKGSSVGRSSQSSSSSTLACGTVAAACCTCGCDGSQVPPQVALKGPSLQPPQPRLLQSSGSAALGRNQQQQQQQPTPAAITAAPSPAQQAGVQPWRVFKGHRNEKKFVGLALLPSAGLMAVGSESSEVFTYHTSWSSPLAKFSIAEQQLQHPLTQPTALTWQLKQQQQQQHSVCAVAWQPSLDGSGCYSPSGASLLAAANSAGDCRLLMLQEA
jgi:E3 ubiquitin-protein ligase RFWD2